MSKQISHEHMRALLDGIADGLPIGALAGIAGLSSPTLTNRLLAPDFLKRLAETCAAYDADTQDLLSRLEHWYRRPGERMTSRRLRQTVAKAIRERFAAEDAAEQAQGKRKRGGGLLRGGIRWYWDAAENRWQHWDGSWWRGSIGG